MANPLAIAALKAAVANHRMKAAPMQVSDFEKKIDLAHEQALAVVKGTRREPLDYPDLSWVKTHLGEAKEALSLPSWATIVDGEGALVGVDKYEQLDPGWIATVTKYLEYLYRSKPPFAKSPQVITIPDTVSLAIAGDWGTGYWEGVNTGAARVAKLMAAADYTIHLGDTYYAGTEDETSANLAAIWPRGSKGSFAVPGNHEMYCNGDFYFAALPHAFPLQAATSFFAMQNTNWLILVLDTSYFATDFYMDGATGPADPSAPDPQRDFVVAQLANKGDRGVILMTHHQPFSIDGGTATPLFFAIQSLFNAGGVPEGPDYWYWGHLHNAVVYQDALANCHGRCIGHGAIPYGDASSLHGNANVVWFENALAGDSRYPKRVLNGFLSLSLAGAKASESLVGENGAVRWKSS